MGDLEKKHWKIVGGIVVALIVIGGIAWVFYGLGKGARPVPIDYDEISKAVSGAMEKPVEVMKAAKTTMEEFAKKVTEVVETMKKPQQVKKVTEKAPAEQGRPPVPFVKEFKVDRSKGVVYKVVGGNRMYMFFVLFDPKRSGGKFQKKLAKEKLRLMKAGKNTAEIREHINKMIAEAGDSESVYRVEAGPYTPQIFDKIMTLLENSPLLGIRGMIGWAPDEEGKLWLNTADEDFLFSIDYGVAKIGPPTGSHLSEDVKKVLRKYKGR
jgi:hypothetical protein